MGNFREITAQVIASGAGIQVVDAAALHQELEGLLNDPNRQQAIANAARELIRLNAGATQRSVAAITAALDNN